MKRAHGEIQWTPWPAPLRDRNPRGAGGRAATLADESSCPASSSAASTRDWRALREHAHARGIGLIGDIPIFVAHDSADVWRTASCSTWTTRGEPTRVAGVPPDYFSATGQRWGNPLYRWDRMRKTGYAWWIERFRATLAAFDAVRMDHFSASPLLGDPGPRADGDQRALGPGPGRAFFEALRRGAAASCRSSPRIWASSRPTWSALRDELRAARHEDPPVCIRRRS